MNNSQEFKPLFRLWHWLMAFSVFGLLFTVLLRKTFLSKGANAEIIQQKLAELSIQIDMDQAISIAKAIRAPMWEWHYIFAVVLGIAIVLRVITMIKGDAKPPIIKLLKAQSKEEKIKSAVHLLICISIMLMALSGAFYYYHDALGFAKESVKWVKEFHEFMMYPVIIFVTLHIIGVIKHELTTKECIVSKMIHGDDCSKRD